MNTSDKNKIKTLCEQKNSISDRVIAIVLAKDFYKQFKQLFPPVYKNDFVVCRWFDYGTPKKPDIEGLETIAICRKQNDAKLLFDVYKKIND